MDILVFISILLTVSLVVNVIFIFQLIRLTHKVDMAKVGETAWVQNYNDLHRNFNDLKYNKKLT